MRSAASASGEEAVLSSAAAEAVAAAALVAVLAWAVIRPWGLPEAVLAVPAAAVVIAAGAITPGGALAEAGRLGPVIGFLAAVLVLAQLCDGEGLFRACGGWLSAAGPPRRLLAQVFLIAAATTAVLSLDATVVLLTPVVFASAARLGVRPKPHVYACTHLANSASLLLPVSNLTNLLAFAASGLAFTRFAGLMTLPWLAAIGVEYLVFRRFFAGDLAAGELASGIWLRVIWLRVSWLRVSWPLGTRPPGRPGAAWPPGPLSRYSRSWWWRPRWQDSRSPRPWG